MRVGGFKATRGWLPEQKPCIKARPAGLLLIARSGSSLIEAVLEIQSPCPDLRQPGPRSLELQAQDAKAHENERNARTGNQRQGQQYAGDQHGTTCDSDRYPPPESQDMSMHGREFSGALAAGRFQRPRKIW